MRNIYSGAILCLFFSISMISKIVAQSTTPVPPSEAAVGIWQCIRGSERMHGTQYMKGSMHTVPTVKWEANLNTNKGGCEGEPVIGDVNGDGKNDVVVTTGMNNVMAFNGTTGALLWDKPSVGGQTSPLIGDADGDGNNDVIVCADKVYCLDGTNGNIKWSFTPTLTGTTKIETSPNMADLDHNGTNEVVVIVQDAIYAINGVTGLQEWKYATGTPTSGTVNGSSPAIGDLNGDGILDVVAHLQAGNPSHLVAVNGNNGSLIWSINVQNGGFGLNATVPAIGDVNGDCKPDVVYNKAAVKGTDGTVIWGNPAALFGATWCILADLNNDCNVEVVTSCGVFKGSDGSTIWNQSTCVSNGWFAPAPRVGDFDPNSAGKEIIIGSSYQIQNDVPRDTTDFMWKPIIMYNGYTGTVLWKLDIAHLYNHTVEGFSIGDIDNDGCVEIVIAPDCCNGNATLMALDDAGNTANCGIIASLSQVNFLPQDTTGCNCANYRDLSPTCTNSWNWTFQGGTPANSTAQNPGSVCYSTNGTYITTMIAKVNGCSDTVTHTITVNCNSVLPPNAQFQSNDSVLCESDCISFTDLSSGSPTNWLWSFPGGVPPTSTDQNPFVCYFTAGDYQVQLIAGNSGGSDTLTANNFIHVSNSPPPPNITHSNDTLYASSDTSYYTYQWYYGANLIPNATNSWVVASQSGNYNLEIKNKLGCSVATGIVLSAASLSAGSNGLTLRPNPAKHQLMLTLDPKNQGGTSAVSIYNVLGEMMQQEELRASSSFMSINIDDLAAGVYFVQVMNESGRWLARFVKE